MLIYALIGRHLLFLSLLIFTFCLSVKLFCMCHHYTNRYMFCLPQICLMAFLIETTLESFANEHRHTLIWHGGFTRGTLSRFRRRRGGHQAHRHGWWCLPQPLAYNCCIAAWKLSSGSTPHQHGANCTTWECSSARACSCLAGMRVSVEVQCSGLCTCLPSPGGETCR